jgi:hypothetical protein
MCHAGDRHWDQLILDYLGYQSGYFGTNQEEVTRLVRRLVRPSPETAEVIAEVLWETSRLERGDPSSGE